jgi:hypothetical protein
MESKVHYFLLKVKKEMLDLQADNTAYFASEIRADTMTKQ